MLASDFPEFEALIRQLEKLYSKTIDDETMQAYWSALRELPMAVVRRKVDEHIKRAKFFPKPAELRPKDSAPQIDHDEKSRRSFDAAVAKNVANWEGRLREDPLHTKWLLLEAYVARINVTEEPDSVEYHERISFARHAAEKLIAESGWAYAGSDTRLAFAVSLALGAQAYKRAIDESHAARLVTAA